MNLSAEEDDVPDTVNDPKPVNAWLISENLLHINHYIEALTGLRTELQTPLPSVMVDPKPVTTRLALWVLPLYVTQ